MLAMLSKISILLALLQTAASEVLRCNIPGNFTLDSHRNWTANVYDANLQVTLDYESLEFYGFAEKKFIGIRGSHVKVDFEGSYMDNFVAAGISSQPEKLKETFNEEITGNGQRMIFNDTTFMIYNCRLILLPINEEKSSTPAIMRNEIRRYAESCLEVHVCEKFRAINRWQFIERESEGKFCFSPGMPNSLGDFVTGGRYHSRGDLGAFQEIINKVVDVTLTDVIAKLKQVNGVMSLPNITHEFTTGKGIMKAKGHFEATGGVFSDLKTVHRSGNIEITRIDNTFRVSCAVGLSIARLHFPKYKIKYGIVKVAGKIDGNIEGIKLEAAASIDYSQMPCVPKIEKLGLSKLGDVSIFLTGLGPLNSLLGSILDMIINSWKHDIVEKAERQMMEMVEQTLKNFDCERYRP